MNCTLTLKISQIPQPSALEGPRWPPPRIQGKESDDTSTELKVTGSSCPATSGLIFPGNISRISYCIHCPGSPQCVHFCTGNKMGCRASFTWVPTERQWADKVKCRVLPGIKPFCYPYCVACIGCLASLCLHIQKDNKSHTEGLYRLAHGKNTHQVYSKCAD